MPRRRQRGNSRTPSSRSDRASSKKRKTRAIGILLGGGLYDPFGGENGARRNARLRSGTVHSKEIIDRDIRMWQHDTDSMVRPFFEERMSIVDMTLPALHPSLSTATTMISSLFARPALHHVIMWYGHGETGTGDWYFGRNEKFTFDDLMDLWLNSPAHRSSSHLILICDTCHSGHWLNRLKALEETLSYQLGRISIQCGSHPHEASRVDSDQRPLSLLLRKMMDPSLHWTLSDQHPTFYQTLSARRYGRNVLQSKGNERDARVIEIEPGFNLVEIRVGEEWEVVRFGRRSDRVRLVGLESDQEGDDGEIVGVERVIL